MKKSAILFPFSFMAFIALVMIMVSTTNTARAKDDACPDCPDTCCCLHSDDMGDFCLCPLPMDGGISMGHVKQISTGQTVPAKFTLSGNTLTVELLKNFSGMKAPAKGVSKIQNMHFPILYCRKAGKQWNFVSGSFSKSSGQFGGFTINVNTRPLQVNKVHDASSTK